MDHAQHPIILFDGACNLCTGTVQFVIRRDPNHIFRFASLQSEFAKEKAVFHNDPIDQLNSFILIENGRLYKRSTAALRVARRLQGGWKLLYAFIILPPFLRDGIYNMISRNRYKWFGRKEACWLPTKELNNLFIA